MAAQAGLNKFREKLAEGFVNDNDPDVFIAIGRGNPDWDNQQQTTATFALDPVNTLAIGATNVVGVILRSLDGVNTYVEGQDYSVDGLTGTVTRLGSGSIADGQQVNIFYNLSLSPLLSQLDLVDEIGRKRATFIGYATPDENGDIVVSSGTFAQTLTPTKHLLFRSFFAVAEAETETIREFGLFVDTVLESGLPGNQLYFEPADVSDPGTLCVVRNVAPVNKQTIGELKQDFVITI